MFGLTDKELEILAKFIDKEAILKPVGVSAFSSEVKKQVANELGIDHANTLNVYIKRLKDKKALLVKDGKYVVNPVAVKHPKETRLEFVWEQKKD
jgi:hypothetical protein